MGMHLLPTAAALLFSLALVCESNAQTQERTRAAASGVANLPERANVAPEEVARSLKPAPGFAASVWAKDLGRIRMFAVAENGTVFLTRPDSGDVLALSGDMSSTSTGPMPRKVVRNLDNVHGIALHGNHMFLATIKEVYVVDLAGDSAAGEPRAIITDLPDGGQHPNRTLGIGPDSMLYISIGSTCNRCKESNMENATIVRASLDGTIRGVYASGLRNTVGFAWHPVTGEMWGFDHGSDWAGNEKPLEELNKLQRGANYGWPFCHGDRQVDSLLTQTPPGSTREEFCKRTAGPVLTYQAHSAPMQMVFLDTDTSPASDSARDAFVAMRGSWNRQPPAGYKIVRVKFENGKPTRVEDFVTGFLRSGTTGFLARPTGIALLKDGSLIVGDDTNGVIYRIARSAQSGTQSPRVGGAGRGGGK